MQSIKSIRVQYISQKYKFDDLGNIFIKQEVDNNLDNQVDKHEFEFMYKRNIYDKNG